MTQRNERPDVQDTTAFRNWVADRFIEQAEAQGLSDGRIAALEKTCAERGAKCPAVTGNGNGNAVVSVKDVRAAFRWVGPRLAAFTLYSVLALSALWLGGKPLLNSIVLHILEERAPATAQEAPK